MPQNDSIFGLSWLSRKSQPTTRQIRDAMQAVIVSTLTGVRYTRRCFAQEMIAPLNHALSQDEIKAACTVLDQLTDMEHVLNCLHKSLGKDI